MSDLLEEARRRLAELDEDGDDVDWGERIELEPGDAFVGRWRGETLGRSKDGGSFTLYLFWGPAGEHRFMFRTTRLEWELQDLQPSVGDEVAVVRGTDLPASEGRSPTQRYAVRSRPSSEPRPDAAERNDAVDDEPPF